MGEMKIVNEEKGDIVEKLKEKIMEEGNEGKEENEY